MRKSRFTNSDFDRWLQLSAITGMSLRAIAEHEKRGACRWSAPL